MFYYIVLCFIIFCMSICCWFVNCFMKVNTYHHAFFKDCPCLKVTIKEMKEKRREKKKKKKKKKTEKRRRKLIMDTDKEKGVAELVKKRVEQEDSKRRGWVLEGLPPSLSLLHHLDSLGVSPNKYVILFSSPLSFFSFLFFFVFVDLLLQGYILGRDRRASKK